MKTQLLISILFLSGSLLSQTRLDKKLIIQAIFDYTKDWGYEILPTYTNKFLQEELEQNKKLRDIGYLLDSPLAKSRQLSMNDTLNIEGFDFSYLSVKKVSESTNNTKIPKFKANNKIDSGKISISIPIFSIDNNIAIVYFDTYCGPLCGTGEIFILERKMNTWKIKDRIFKRVY